MSKKRGNHLLRGSDRLRCHREESGPSAVPTYRGMSPAYPGAYRGGCTNQFNAAAVGVPGFCTNTSNPLLKASGPRSNITGRSLVTGFVWLLY